MRLGRLPIIHFFLDFAEIFDKKIRRKKETRGKRETRRLKRQE